MNLQTVHNSQRLNELALLTGSQIRSLSSVISRICQDEPNLEYIVPDQAVRRMVLPSVLQAAILAGQLYGQVRIGENHDGIAVWISAEHNLRFRQIMQTTLPQECLERYMKLAESVEVARTHLAVRPHWYLMLLAADASLTDKIIGETLIAPLLSQADSTATCYLETFDASRLSLYINHGFEITGAGRIPDGGPNFWTMATKVVDATSSSVGRRTA
jgi:hypothetical protein